MKSIKTYLSFIFLFYCNIIFAKQDNKYLDETFYIPPTKSIEELHTKLNDILNKVNTQKYSVSIYSLDRNQYYYEKNSHLPLTPASLTKLFSTFNTINTVGADFKYQTKVFLNGAIKNDTLFGSLLVKGSGDPLFNINDLEQLADQIKNSGIKYITGDIIADGRVFDNVFNRINYSGDADIVEPTPPIAGLSIARNTVTVLVTAGKAGEFTRVQCYPNSDYFKINNHSIVKKILNQRKKKLKIKGKSAALQKYNNYYGDELRSEAKRSNITINSKQSNDNFQLINVNGVLPPGSTYSYQIFINNPNKAFAGALYKRLLASNVKIKGQFREVHGNELVLYSNLIQLAIKERDIWEVINIMNKESDNYLAESIYKLYANIISQNSNKSISELKDSISKHLYLKCEECLFNDGSGLSRRNLVTSDLLISLLKSAYHSNYKDKFFNSLAIGGIDGTIKKRFRSNTSYNNVRAKTGTLRNASGLAGIVKTLDGENLIFAFIFNGNDIGNYKYIENQLAELLTSFYIETPLSNQNE